MGHTCSSLSCVNHPIGKPKELTQTYGVWNVEAAWIRIRKDLALVLPVVEQRKLNKLRMNEKCHLGTHKAKETKQVVDPYL